MFGILSSCPIVTLTLRRAVFFWYSTSKTSWPWILKCGSEVTQGHWKCYYSIDFVWFSSYQRSIETLSLRCTVLRYSTSKMPWPWKTYWVTGPSTSLEMSPCDRSHMISYWRSVVTMALSRDISEIFNVEECRDLEMGVKGHSRSLRVISFHRLCMVSY